MTIENLTQQPKRPTEEDIRSRVDFFVNISEDQLREYFKKQIELWANGTEEPSSIFKKDMFLGWTIEDYKSMWAIYQDSEKRQVKGVDRSRID